MSTNRDGIAKNVRKFKYMGNVLKEAWDSDTKIRKCIGIAKDEFQVSRCFPKCVARHIIAAKEASISGAMIERFKDFDSVSKNSNAKNNFIKISNIFRTPCNHRKSRDLNLTKVHPEKLYHSQKLQNI